jgi:hypothetical protein
MKGILKLSSGQYVNENIFLLPLAFSPAWSPSSSLEACHHQVTPPPLSIRPRASSPHPSYNLQRSQRPPQDDPAYTYAYTSVPGPHLFTHCHTQLRFPDRLAYTFTTTAPAGRPQGNAPARLPCLLGGILPRRTCHETQRAILPRGGDAAHAEYGSTLKMMCL